MNTSTQTKWKEGGSTLAAEVLEKQVKEKLQWLTSRASKNVSRVSEGSLLYGTSMRYLSMCMQSER